MENIMDNSMVSNSEIFNGEDLTSNEMTKNLELIGIKVEKKLKRRDMVKKYNEAMSSEENKSKLLSLTSKSYQTTIINDFNANAPVILSSNSELDKLENNVSKENTEVEKKSKGDSKGKSVSDEISTSMNTNSIAPFGKKIFILR